MPSGVEGGRVVPLAGLLASVLPLCGSLRAESMARLRLGSDSSSGRRCTNADGRRGTAEKSHVPLKKQEVTCLLAFPRRAVNARAFPLPPSLPPDRPLVAVREGRLVAKQLGGPIHTGDLDHCVCNPS